MPRLVFAIFLLATTQLSCCQSVTSTESVTESPSSSQSAASTGSPSPTPSSPPSSSVSSSISQSPVIMSNSGTTTASESTSPSPSQSSSDLSASASSATSVSPSAALVSPSLTTSPTVSVSASSSPGSPSTSALVSSLGASETSSLSISVSSSQTLPMSSSPSPSAAGGTTSSTSTPNTAVSVTSPASFSASSSSTPSASPSASHAVSALASASLSGSQAPSGSIITPSLSSSASTLPAASVSPSRSVGSAPASVSATATPVSSNGTSLFSSAGSSVLTTWGTIGVAIGSGVVLLCLLIACLFACSWENSMRRRHESLRAHEQLLEESRREQNALLPQQGADAESKVDGSPATARESSRRGSKRDSFSKAPENLKTDGNITIHILSQPGKGSQSGDVLGSSSHVKPRKHSGEGLSAGPAVDEDPSRSTRKRRHHHRNHRRPLSRLTTRYADMEKAVDALHTIIACVTEDEPGEEDDDRHRRRLKRGSRPARRRGSGKLSPHLRMPSSMGPMYDSQGAHIESSDGEVDSLDTGALTEEVKREELRAAKKAVIRQQLREHDAMLMRAMQQRLIGLPLAAPATSVHNLGGVGQAPSSWFGNHGPESLGVSLVQPTSTASPELRMTSPPIVQPSSAAKLAGNESKAAFWERELGTNAAAAYGMLRPHRESAPSSYLRQSGLHKVPETTGRTVYW